MTDLASLTADQLAELVLRDLPHRAPIAVPSHAALAELQTRANDNQHYREGCCLDESCGAAKRAEAAEKERDEALKRERVANQAAIKADERTDAAEKWQQNAEERAEVAEARLAETQEVLREIAEGNSFGSVHLQEIARAALTTHPAEDDQVRPPADATPFKERPEMQQIGKRPKHADEAKP